jgi:hypothetical protein
MKLRAFACLFVVLAVVAVAHTQSLATYDDFDGSFINPAKWSVFAACATVSLNPSVQPQNPTAYDCVREQRDDVLRLGLRAYSSNTSDTGILFSGSGVQFRNPGPINTIRVKTTINSFSTQGCPANSEPAHPQFLISGRYFNAGSGTFQDDVQAYVMIERTSDDLSLPQTILRVGAFMSIGSAFFNNVDLGTIQTGEEATLTLTWKRDNKAFVAQVVRQQTMPLVEEQTMSYSQSDSLPPSFPIKGIQVGTFVPNCTANVAFAAMKARISVVRVNAGAF